MYINDPKCLRMSQHHLGLHNIQLVFHFCLYMPCDTKCHFFLEWLIFHFVKRPDNLRSNYTLEGKQHHTISHGSESLSSLAL